MKKHLLLISGLFLSSLFYVAQSQIVYTSQSDAESVKDAKIWTAAPDRNYGESPALDVFTWTYKGETTIKRSLLEFDLSGLPANTVVDSAFLYLYFNPTYGSIKGHFGDNRMYVMRIKEEWLEDSVTWNNMPLSTIQNKVEVPASTDPKQDYEIDVTTLVQDMVDNPWKGKGFMLRMKDEVNPDKGVIFASSDHPNETLHPHLVAYLSFDECKSKVVEVIVKDTVPIYDTISVVDSIQVVDTVTEILYETVVVYDTVTDCGPIVIEAPSGIDQVDLGDLLVYPNPIENILNIEASDYFIYSNYTVQITDIAGQVILSSPIIESIFSIDVDIFGEPGIYMLSIYDLSFNLVESRELLLQ